MAVTKAEGAVGKLSDTLTVVGGVIIGLLEIFTGGIMPMDCLTCLQLPTHPLYTESMILVEFRKRCLKIQQY